MNKIKPVYTLPDEMDRLSGLLQPNSCEECTHIKNVENYNWYQLGDFSTNADCAKLGQRVSSHVGTCSAFRMPILAHVWRIWQRLVTCCVNIYWWIIYRCVTKHKYHIVQTGLKPGYCDPGERLLAAIFTEVTDFVANNNHWDWEESEGHTIAWKAFQHADEFGNGYLTALNAGETTESDDYLAMRYAKKVIDNYRYMWY